ncbi:MAG: class I SAM-dependent methyltransferase [Pseudomonadota bacterium]
MLNWLRALTNQSAVWPPIDAELDDLTQAGLLKGMVLNAGSGWREVRHLVDGTVVNQDLHYPGDARTNLDIVSPLHRIPKPDGTFDGVLCIAVLEHVENPVDVVAELFRVTKPGGFLVCTVPFLQPEHKIPADFQRYTRDGLEALLVKAGYEIEQTKALYTVWHTLHWIIYEWLHLRDTFLYRALRVLLLPPLVWLSRNSDVVSDKLATAFRVLARKPVGGAPDDSRQDAARPDRLGLRSTVG